MCLNVFVYTMSCLRMLWLSYIGFVYDDMDCVSIMAAEDAHVLTVVADDAFLLGPER